MSSRFFAEHRDKIIFFSLVIIGVIAFILLRGDNQVLRFRTINVSEIPVFHQAGSYAEFLYNHAETPRGTSGVEIDIFNPSSGLNYEVINEFEGARVLRTEEDSFVEFTVNIPTAGLYNLNIEYFPISSRVDPNTRGIDISREVRINGELPFFGADLIVFRRVWGSDDVRNGVEFTPATSTRPATFVRQDDRGNQIRPPQVELPRWERAYFTDRLGYFTDPYRFYFTAGENTISLTGLNEPLILRSFSVTPITDLPTQAEFIETTPLRTIETDFSELVQGEWSTFRSSPSLFPMFDSSSGITDPPSVAAITLNMIGGLPWRLPGQWIEWDVEVPYDGLYNLSIKARQNYNRGVVSNRTIEINGQIPFTEAAAVPFQFNNNWELITLQDASGNNLLFPMNAGVNTIRMYVTLGEFGELVDALNASVRRLNAIYREIMVLTGAEPDNQRDYRVHHFLPHVVGGVKDDDGVIIQQSLIYEETEYLYGILTKMEEYLGERNEHTGIITATIQQLDMFEALPYRIPNLMINFRQKISAIANAAAVLTESPLDIDYFIVSGTSATLPKVNETFLSRLSHEVRAFGASFTHNYEQIGEIHEGSNIIDVWIPTGRDQATIMKAMIDDTFTPESGIGVNLRLVGYDAILPAFVAGIGPDVAMSMLYTAPTQYAFRNAAYDLTQFDDFYDIYGRFHESAWVRLGYLDGYYALPETQHFNLMFYRNDILDELGFEPPRTWDDVFAMMPILNRLNMHIGIPPIGDAMAPDITGYLVQLYQRGGSLYNEELSRAALDDEKAIAAFETFTRFFTHYGSPKYYNAVNRFRSGEMPIIFVDMGQFNMLSVFAPEIYGQWSFGLMPGYDHGVPTRVFDTDRYEQVHHTISDWGSAAIMNQASEMKEESWEFMKWWTSAETQIRFSREMESIMGEAARFPTANMEAFQSLPWTTEQLRILNEQRDWIMGTPEVPGGYYVQRQLVNVIRRVVENKLDARETLLDANIVVNRELVSKRREFGLED